MVRWRPGVWMGLASLSALFSVLAGAFAAHGLPDGPGRELLRTGAAYQISHALACFACAAFIQWGARRARFAPAFFLGGTVLFSGGLYALALGAPRWIGAVAPIGGLLFIGGWAVLAWAARDIASIEAEP